MEALRVDRLSQSPRLFPGHKSLSPCPPREPTHAPHPSLLDGVPPFVADMSSPSTKLAPLLDRSHDVFPSAMDACPSVKNLKNNFALDASQSYQSDPKVLTLGLAKVVTSGREAGPACDLSGSLLVLAHKLREAEFKVHGRRSNPTPPLPSAATRPPAGFSRCVGPAGFRFQATQKRSIDYGGGVGRDGGGEGVESKRCCVDGVGAFEGKGVALTGESELVSEDASDLDSIPHGSSVKDKLKDKDSLKDTQTEQRLVAAMEEKLVAGVEVLEQLWRMLCAKPAYCTPSSVQGAPPTLPSVGGGGGARALLWPLLSSVRATADENAELLAYLARNRTQIDAQNRAFHARPHSYTKPLSAARCAAVVDAAVQFVADARRRDMQRTVCAALHRIDLGGGGTAAHNGPSSAQPSPAPACTGDAEGAEDAGDQTEGGGVKIPLRFSCDQCPYTSDNRSHLVRHKNSIHLTHRPYACYVCLKPFSRTDNVRTHFRTAHARMTYRPDLVRKIAPVTMASFALAEPAGFGAPVAAKRGFVEGVPAVVKDAASDHGDGVPRDKQKGCEEPRCPHGTKPHGAKNGAVQINGFSSVRCGGNGSASPPSKRAILQNRVERRSLFACVLCRKSFASLDMLEVHTATSHLRRLGVCRPCAFHTLDPREYAWHREEHRGSRGDGRGGGGGGGGEAGGERWRQEGHAIRREAEDRDLKQRGRPIKHQASGNSDELSRPSDTLGNDRAMSSAQARQHALSADRQRRRLDPADLTGNGVVAGNSPDDAGRRGEGMRSIFDALGLRPTKPGDEGKKSVSAPRSATPRGVYDPPFVDPMRPFVDSAAAAFVAGYRDSAATPPILASRPFPNQLSTNKQPAAATPVSQSQSTGRGQSVVPAQNTGKGQSQSTGRGLSAVQSQSLAAAGGKLRPTPRSNKVFQCKLCPERPPFRYRKSFDKHLLQHAYEARHAAAGGGAPAIVPSPRNGLVASPAFKAPSMPAAAVPRAVMVPPEPMYLEESDPESDGLEYRDDPSDADFKI